MTDSETEQILVSRQLAVILRFLVTQGIQNDFMKWSNSVIPINTHRLVINVCTIFDIAKDFRSATLPENSRSKNLRQNIANRETLTSEVHVYRQTPIWLRTKHKCVYFHYILQQYLTRPENNVHVRENISKTELKIILRDLIFHPFCSFLKSTFSEIKIFSNLNKLQSPLI